MDIHSKQEQIKYEAAKTNRPTLALIGGEAGDRSISVTGFKNDVAQLVLHSMKRNSHLKDIICKAVDHYRANVEITF